MDVKRRLEGLYAIVDNTFSPQWSHVELASMFLMGGCKVLQLRIKNIGSRLTSLARIVNYTSGERVNCSSGERGNYSSGERGNYSSSETKWSREDKL